MNSVLSPKYMSVGALTLSAKAETNEKANLTKEIAKKLRRVGTYRATAQATDAAGNKRNSSVRFRVVRG